MLTGKRSFLVEVDYRATNEMALTEFMNLVERELREVAGKKRRFGREGKALKCRIPDKGARVQPIPNLSDAARSRYGLR